MDKTDRQKQKSLDAWRAVFLRGPWAWRASAARKRLRPKLGIDTGGRAGDNDSYLLTWEESREPW